MEGQIPVPKSCRVLSAVLLAAVSVVVALAFGLETHGDQVYLAITRYSTNVVVVWNGGQLQRAKSLDRNWETLTNAASPYTESATTGNAAYFRIRN
jgi:hypothetical protein